MKLPIKIILLLLFVIAPVISTPAASAGLDFKIVQSSVDSEPEWNKYYLPLVLLTFPPAIGELRNEWYLMVDDGHIASRDVNRVYHPFKKYVGNPILMADQPWESKVVQLYGMVLPGFRMWYSTYSHSEDAAHVLYAESTDGLIWRKPNLNGTSHNVLFDGEKAVLPSVTNIPQDRNQPYRLLVYQHGVFNGYRSSNGTANTPYTENPLFSNNSDVALFYWDPNTLRYRGTTKERATVNGISRRAVRFIDSIDLLTWEQEPDLLAPDNQDDLLNPGFYPHFYGMPVFAIGEQYLGLLWMMNARDIDGEFGQTYIQLASSHDGTHWIREEGDRPPILDHGSPGEWDDGQVYTSNRPVRVGNELWLYYSGCDQEHSTHLPITVCSIGLAVADYNRLVSLTGTGIILTDILSATGKTLHLNYDASQGQVRVQLNSNGVPIPGYEAENCMPMMQNSQDQVVTWMRGILLPETPFQIEIRLVTSSIFAFAQLD
jgi:hypothetical protein